MRPYRIGDTIAIREKVKLDLSARICFCGACEICLKEMERVIGRVVNITLTTPEMVREFNETGTLKQYGDQTVRHRNGLLG